MISNHGDQENELDVAEQLVIINTAKHCLGEYIFKEAPECIVYQNVHSFQSVNEIEDWIGRFLRNGYN